MSEYTNAPKEPSRILVCRACGVFCPTWNDFLDHLKYCDPGDYQRRLKMAPAPKVGE